MAKVTLILPLCVNPYHIILLEISKLQHKSSKIFVEATSLKKILNEKCSGGPSKLILCWPTFKDLLHWLFNNILSFISHGSTLCPGIKVDTSRFESFGIRSGATLCSLENRQCRAWRSVSVNWALTLLVLLPYYSFKYKGSPAYPFFIV